MADEDCYLPPAAREHGEDDRDGSALFHPGAHVPYRRGYRIAVLTAASLNLLSGLAAVVLLGSGLALTQHLAVGLGGAANCLVFAAVALRMRQSALEVAPGWLIWRRGVFADRRIPLREIVRVERRGRSLRLDRRRGAALVVPLVFLDPRAVAGLVR